MRAHPGCAQRGRKAGQCSSKSQGAGRPQALCPHKRTCWHRVKSGRSEGEAFGGDQPVNETSAFPKGPQGAWPPPPRRGQEPWWAAGTGAEGEHWPLPCHAMSTARTEAQARSPGQARVRRESRPPEASLWMKSEGQPPRDQEREGRRSRGDAGGDGTLCSHSPSPKLSFRTGNTGPAAGIDAEVRGTAGPPCETPSHSSGWA